MRCEVSSENLPAIDDFREHVGKLFQGFDRWILFILSQIFNYFRKISHLFEELSDFLDLLVEVVAVRGLGREGRKGSASTNQEVVFRLVVAAAVLEVAQ